MPLTIVQVTVNIYERASAGPHQMILRTTTQGRSMINQAAGLIGMSQADFMRTAIVGVAQAVLDEARARSDNASLT